jgi:hypothetical protein
VVFGYIEAPANALAYSWKYFIGGHLGRLGTRDDVTLHQQYMADIAENSRKAIDTVDPTRYFMKYGDNTWAAVKGYLDEVTRAAAAPVIEKYTGVLAAADVFTESTTSSSRPSRPRRDPTRFPSCLRDRRSAVCGMARRHEPGR